MGANAIAGPATLSNTSFCGRYTTLVSSGWSSRIVVSQVIPTVDTRVVAVRELQPDGIIAHGLYTETGDVGIVRPLMQQRLIIRAFR